MTAEELKQYNALSERMKVEYSQIKSEHPDWSHAQIMMKIALDHTMIGGPIGGDVGDIDDDESLWDKIKNIFR